MEKQRKPKKLSRNKLITNLQEHNGPCETVGQLNAALINYKSEKHEIRYLQKENWCLATTTRVCAILILRVPLLIVPYFDLDQEFTQTKKRKQIFTESDNFKKPTDNSF